MRYEQIDMFAEQPAVSAPAPWNEAEMVALADYHDRIAEVWGPGRPGQARHVELAAVVRRAILAYHQVAP